MSFWTDAFRLMLRPCRLDQIPRGQIIRACDISFAELPEIGSKCDATY